MSRCQGGAETTWEAGLGEDPRWASESTQDSGLGHGHAILGRLGLGKTEDTVWHPCPGDLGGNGGSRNRNRHGQGRGAGLKLKGMKMETGRGVGPGTERRRPEALTPWTLCPWSSSCSQGPCLLGSAGRETQPSHV